MKTRTAGMITLMREHGFKITPQRRAILDIIAGSAEHLTPAAIYDQVCHLHPGIGRVTVYRTLEVLAKLGSICRMHVNDTCRSYSIRRPSAHHHHLICSDCGQVVDFTDCQLNRLEQRLARQTGFKVEEHLLELHGQCRRATDCRQYAGATRAAHRILQQFAGMHNDQPLDETDRRIKGRKHALPAVPHPLQLARGLVPRAQCV